MTERRMATSSNKLTDQFFSLLPLFSHHDGFPHGEVGLRNLQMTPIHTEDQRK